MTEPASAPSSSAVTDPLRIGVLLFDGVEPLDAIGPAQVFWSLGSTRAFLPPFRPVEVHLVAEEARPIVAGYGLVIHPTITYADCPPLDALIVPGGTGGEVDDDLATIGRRFQARHPATLSFVRDRAADAAIVASVCTGAFILAGADVLAGHRGNTHWAARAELVAFMAARGESFDLVVDRVVDDGSIVTGGGVSSGIDIALHLVGRLIGPDVRDAVASVIERETPPAALPV